MNIQEIAYKEMNNYTQKISISMFIFILSLLFTGIVGKLGDKFLEKIYFFITIFSLFYFFYTVYKYIRIYCGRKV